MGSNEYFTVARSARVKIPVGACRFIASVSPCRSTAEARGFIRSVKEEFRDATHNAYAYRLGTGDQAVSYCDDDREPAGTSGLPMLQAIEKAGLTDVAVVGTRYFGGVKLGIGGLIRAYRSCAEEGLKAAGIKKKVKAEELAVRVPYDSVGKLFKAVASRGGELQDVEYDRDVTVKCRIPLSNIKGFVSEVRDITRGRGEIAGLSEDDNQQ